MWFSPPHGGSRLKANMDQIKMQFNKRPARYCKYNDGLLFCMALLNIPASKSIYFVK